MDIARSERRDCKKQKGRTTSLNNEALLPGGIVWATLKLDWDVNGFPVSSYRLLRNGKETKTIAKATRSTRTPTFSAARLTGKARNVFTLVALDANGDAVAISRAITVTIKPRPAGLRKAIPAWAWPFLRWQHTNPAKRGAGPFAPKRLPDWYQRWATWRIHPVMLGR